MIPKEYHYDDIGAPQLTNKAGDILNILKACLITGYGSKAGAGWKLQYDGWTAKGEQKLAFSVGDETEQELIYFLDNSTTSATFQIYAEVNNGEPSGQITTNGYSNIIPDEKIPQWHLYATNKFCWFIHSALFSSQFKFFGFGCLTDLFGEFLPQGIIHFNYSTGMGSNAAYILKKQTSLSCGGSLYLPCSAFQDNSNYLRNIQLGGDIEYAYKSLCAFSTGNSTPALRFYLPAWTCYQGAYLNTGLELQEFNKNGSRFIKFFANYLGNMVFTLDDWDNPEWLQDLMN